MTEDIQDFTMPWVSESYRPFSGTGPEELLSEAYALLRVISNAFEDAEVTDDNALAAVQAARKAGGGVSGAYTSALNPLSGFIKARAFSGVATLIALAAYMHQDEGR